MRPQPRTVSAMQPAAATRHASEATFHVNEKTKSFHQNVLSHPVRNPTLNWQGVAEGQEPLQRHATITIHCSETETWRGEGNDCFYCEYKKPQGYYICQDDCPKRSGWMNWWRHFTKESTKASRWQPVVGSAVLRQVNVMQRDRLWYL